MGHRTVVMLNNDTAFDWENDPELGKKIACHLSNGGYGLGEYGSVVEVTHADTQTLAVIDGYTGFTRIAGDRNTTATLDELALSLLKEAAKKLGYRLVKAAKPTK